VWDPTVPGSRLAYELEWLMSFQVCGFGERF